MTRKGNTTRDPLLSWAITWIVAAWVYLWPFWMLHGSTRIFVGIPWLAVALAVTAWVASIRREVRGRKP